MVTHCNELHWSLSVIANSKLSIIIIVVIVIVIYQ